MDAHAIGFASVLHAKVNLGYAIYRKVMLCDEVGDKPNRLGYSPCQQCSDWTVCGSSSIQTTIRLHMSMLSGQIGKW
jgi:hypothetical protein